MNHRNLIKNRDDIGITSTRRSALDIIEAGIERVLPDRLLGEALTFNHEARAISIMGDTFSFRHGRLFVVGAGKAAGEMAVAVERILGAGTITAGVVSCKGGAYSTKRIEVLIAGHPVPDERGVAAATKMLDLKAEFNISSDDIVLCLLSGGGSSLLPAPVNGVSLADKQRVTDHLICSGADIGEINAVRKHLSRVKGGGLGRHFEPATVVSLIISDVVGNEPSVIASGPAAADPSTFIDALSVIRKYGLADGLPPSVLDYLERGRRGDAPETPKTLPNCRNYIVGDNRLALEAAAQRAAALGYRPLIITSEQTGDTAAIARYRAAEIITGKYAAYNVLLLGGETTPRVPGNAGWGGRNQHYTAASMLAMENYPGNWLVCAIGTDGTDYLAEVAGAVVDQEALATARRQGIDIVSHLERFDSNTLLNTLGHSLVVTGETGTNVGDAVLYMLGG